MPGQEKSASPWSRTAGWKSYSFERTIGDDERAAATAMVGDIVLGRVQRVMPGMQAAFVEIGLERAGFLACARRRFWRAMPATTPAISDCVREGEAVLVQVIKDPIGEKGARLSAGDHLAGPLAGDDAGPARPRLVAPYRRRSQPRAT